LRDGLASGFFLLGSPRVSRNSPVTSSRGFIVPATDDDKKLARYGNAVFFLGGSSSQGVNRRT